MRKEDKICIDCGHKGVKERRRCEDCAQKHNRERMKKYGRYMYDSICVYCGKSMKAWRKTQLFHDKCYREFCAKEATALNNTSGHYKARKSAELLGIEIKNGYCIHHIDQDPYNNNAENLLYMSKKAHNNLHSFLKRHRSLWLKDQSKYPEDCWKTLRVHLTTARLETTDAKVLKLSEIGQSAGEPLSSEEYGEASEAMHGNPKSI